MCMVLGGFDVDHGREMVVIMYVERYNLVSDLTPLRVYVDSIEQEIV